MRQLLTLLALPLVGFALGGCMYKQQDQRPPGDYEQSSRTVDSKGTARTNDTTTHVYYDPNGNKKSVTARQTTTDPKGLMNKSTTTSRQTIE